VICDGIAMLFMLLIYLILKILKIDGLFLE